MKKRFLVMAIIASSMAYADEFYGTTSVNLEDTVVSTTGFAEDRKNVTASVVVVTSEEIKEKNYKTVSEVLKATSNVNITYNVFGGVVDLRGQGDRAKAKVQILVDGVNINPIDVGHGVTPLNSIDIENVERIEVVSGGGAVVYGSGTAGGVINIITKRNLGDSKITGNVGVDIASYNTNSYNLSLAGKITDKLELGATYNGAQGDGYRKYSDMEKSYLALDSKYKVSDKQNLSIKLGKYEDAYHSPAYLTKAQLDSDRTGASEASSSLVSAYDTTRDEYALHYDYELSPKAKFALVSSLTEMTTTAKSFTTSYNSTTIFGDDKLSIKPKFSYDYKLGNLVLGYDYVSNDAIRDSDYTGMMATSSNTYDMNKTSNSFYLSNRFDLGKIQINAGLRSEEANYNIQRLNYLGTKTYDLNREMEDEAYSLGLNYLYSDSGKIFVKYENGYTLPNPTAFVNKVNSTTFVLSDIKNEGFSTYEIGFEDNIGKTNLRGALYTTETTDEIAITMQGMSAWTYYNLDSTSRLGAEFSMEHYLGKLTLKEGLSYVDAKVTEGTYKDKKIPNVSEISASVDVKYEFNNKFDLSANTQYKDKYYLDAANASGLVNDKFITNVTGNYKVNNKFKVYAGINNLFDEEYFNNISYTSSTKTFTYDPAEERNYFAGFKYSF